MYEFRLLNVARSREELRTLLRIDSSFRLFLVFGAIAIMAVTLLAGGSGHAAATLLIAVAASVASLAAWRRFIRLLPA
jgi:hypothetical protein